MLEIVILIILGGKIGKIAESKGRGKGGYVFMLIGLWIVGEIAGALLGVILAAVSEAGEAGTLLILGCALGGAIIGAVIAFQIAKNAAPLESDDDDYHRGIEYADRLGAGEHFDNRPRTAPPATDAVRESGDKAPRRDDDRVQE